MALHSSGSSSAGGGDDSWVKVMIVVHDVMFDGSISLGCVGGHEVVVVVSVLHGYIADIL